MTLHVTSRLDTVTGDVIRDILTVAVTKNVLPVTLGWIVESYAEVIV